MIKSVYLQEMGRRRGIIIQRLFYTVINMCYFVALVYMCCYVVALPFSSKGKKYLVVVGTGLIVVINILICFLFPETAIGATALFTQTIPSMVICWIASRHKDARFLFIFCALDVIGFILLLFTNGIASMLHASNVISSVIYLLFLVGYLFLFRRYRLALRRVAETLHKNWNRLAFFVLLFYMFSYFLILYPDPWKNRPEYSPVIVGYAILILYCFYIILWTLIDMDRIQNLEQKEYEMHLRIEKQNRELEEKKSRIMLHKIQPHFIYNVLMSIRYFVKKDPQVAYDMIYDFSNYLRSNMEQLGNEGYISWSEELKHVDTYVRIEKMRFKERLNIVYEIEGEDFMIPPMVVEPLVENAVKHGIIQKVSGGTVWIRSRSTEAGNEIIIEDNGVGFDVESIEEGKSVGFDYIRARLAMMEGASMQIDSTPGQGTRILLTFADVRAIE